MRAVFLMLLVLSLLCGCTKYNQLTPEQRETILKEKLPSGAMLLDCGLNCYWVLSHSLDDLDLMYRTKRWDDLALETIRIGHKDDIGYFYLGEAALAHKYYKAANAYFALSNALNTDGDDEHHCRKIPGCRVDLAPTIRDRLKYTKDMLARAHFGFALNSTIKVDGNTVEQFTDGVCTTCNGQNGAPISGAIENITLGDLDGDGVPDAAIMFWCNTIRNGKQYYIGIVHGPADRRVSAKSSPVGEVVSLKDFSVIAERINFSATVRTASNRVERVSSFFLLKKDQVVWQRH